MSNQNSNLNPSARPPFSLEGQNKMGSEFASVFHSIANEIVNLTFRWNEYKILYKKQERVDLLNAAAPLFSYTLQNVLIENIILNIAKITDPVKVGKDKSMTILLLRGYIGDIDFLKFIKPLIATVVTTSEFSKDLRNQWIVHKDFNRAVGNQATTLTLPTEKMIDNFLKSTYELLNAIESKYLGSTTMYAEAEFSTGCSFITLQN